MKVQLTCLTMLLAALVSCESSDVRLSRQLHGTWISEPTDGMQGSVTYKADGTWTGLMSVASEDGAKKEYNSHGTWKVMDGAIHNTVLHHDLDGLLEKGEPLLSVEKLVSVGVSEYRYVCPFQGCTNTMQRVVDPKPR